MLSAIIFIEAGIQTADIFFFSLSQFNQILKPPTLTRKKSYTFSLKVTQNLLDFKLGQFGI